MKGFIGVVNESMIDKELVDNMPLDTNLQIIYDKLKAMVNDSGDGTKFLSDDGTYKTIIAAQSDWNVDDESDPAHVKNRLIRMIDKTQVKYKDVFTKSEYTTYGAESTGSYFIINLPSELLSGNVVIGGKTITTAYDIFKINCEFKLIVYEGAYENPKLEFDLKPYSEGDGCEYSVSLSLVDGFMYEAYITPYGSDTISINLGDQHIHGFYLEPCFTLQYKETKEVKMLVKADGTPLTAPYIVDSESYKYGDDALQAILNGRQVLIKVPNIGGGTYTANFMPVLQYQLPNVDNNYLYLIYLKDGIAQNLTTELGKLMSGGSPDFSNLYGEIKMMLKQTYTSCPLQTSPLCE